MVEDLELGMVAMMKLPVLEEETVSRSFRFVPDGTVGPVCTKLYNRITGIQFGEVEDIHGWCHHVDL